jgi:formylglycine-generating enzyme required for sulfatase activity
MWLATRMPQAAPRVFISYSHDSEEHRERVLGLCERLRKDGVDASLDRYVGGTPQNGWPRWTHEQLQSANFVILVCTAEYYRRFWGDTEVGHGVNFEGAIVTQELYDHGGVNTKYIPVLLAATDEHFIPEPLRATTRYTLNSEPAYQALYDYILGQSGIEPGSLGELKRRARGSGTATDFTTPSAPPVSPRPSEDQLSAAARSVPSPATRAGNPLPFVPPLVRRAWPFAGGALFVAAGAWGFVSFRSLPPSTPQGSFSPGCAPNYAAAKNGSASADDIQFIHLPGGRFTSCPDGFCQTSPSVIKPFALSRTEISQAQFFDYLRELREKKGADALPGSCWYRDPTKPASWRFPNEDTGVAPTGEDGNYPVVCITQEEARDYAHWLGRRLGATVRLPTALEWEYAATAAGKCRPYSWGDQWPPTAPLANVADATARETLKFATNEQRPLENYRDGYAYSAPVGKFPPNPFGLFDMTGNVYEWVEDQCAAYGGSWDTGDGRLSMSTHPFRKSRCNDRFSATGFRVVREDQ